MVMLGARACGIPEGEGPGAEREKRRRMTRGQGGEEERWLIQCGGRRGRSELDLRLEICREGLGEAWLKALEKEAGERRSSLASMVVDRQLAVSSLRAGRRK